MNEETTKLIESLAAKLGTTAEYLWTVLINQAHVHGIKMIIISALLLIAAPILAYTSKTLLKKCGNAGTFETEFGYQFGGVASGASACLALCFGVSAAFEAITPLINPEYWALQEILKHI